jgi:hypothetical protein
MAEARSFLDAVREDHTEHTEEVAARLEGGLQHITSADDVPPYAGMVVHVMGEHLGEWERGARLLDRIGSLPVVQGSDAAAASLRRGTAALRYAGGDASAVQGLSGPDLAQVMCVICTTHTARHETDAAIAALRRALDAAAPGLPDKHPAIRSLAVAGNNLSAELEEKPQLTDAEREAMVLAAETGLKYWKLAGTWLQEERAEFQLARCLLRTGRIDTARERIQRCIAICEANDAPAFERFFGHAVLAFVERQAGNGAAFEAAKAAALADHANIPADEQQWCRRELDELG